jgi:hypothetical protein
MFESQASGELAAGQLNISVAELVALLVARELEVSLPLAPESVRNLRNLCDGGQTSALPFEMQIDPFQAGESSVLPDRAIFIAGSRDMKIAAEAPAQQVPR